VAIACLVVIPTCLCREVSELVGTDDGGQTALVDAGLDAGDAGVDGGLDAGKTAVDAGPDAGEDAGPDAGFDAGRDSGVPPFPDSGAVACDHPISDLDASVTYPLGNGIWLFASAADLNGDGLLDLIEGWGGGFSVLFGLPDGGLSEPTQHDFLTDWWAVGDVNGDGRPDLVLSTIAPPYGLMVFLNDGRGGFPQTLLIPTPSVAAGIAIGDLNGDGRADLLANTNDGQNPDDPKAWFWEVFLQVADGGFAASGWLGIAPGFGSAPSPWAQAVFSDLNGDGLPDLVTTTEDQAHVAVLLNQGDGGFETTLYQVPALGQIGLLPRAGRLPDIVVGESGFTDPVGQTALGIGVMANRGDGTFAEPVTYANPGGNVFAIGDFNGDCIPDIATPPNLGYCQAGWPISVLYGDADGGFSSPVYLTATGEGPSTIAVLGPVDNPRTIAVADYCGGVVTVYGDASQH